MADVVTICPGMPLSNMVLAGATENMELVGSTEKAVTVNGRTMMLGMPWGRKWNVKLSNSGDGRRSPPLDDLNLGDQFEYWVTHGFSRSMAPGQVSILLDRDPVPGSIEALDAITDKPVNFSIAGRTVTIGGRAGYTRVSYRPILNCIVVGISGISSDVTGLGQSWSLELEEEYAP